MMSKKDKEVRKLRREIEILRAQMKGVREPVETGHAPSLRHREPSVPSEPSATYVRTDLRRSFLITAVILALIGALSLSQPHWPKVATLATRILPF